MRHSHLLGSLLFSATLIAQGPVLEPLTVAVERMASALRLTGAALTVQRDSGEIHRSQHGNLTSGSIIPIASASKWLAVATVLTVVDDGMLDLDAPVARYLSEFDRPDKKSLTLRQCLACTAGLPARIGGRMSGWDSDKFVAAVADAPLRAGPGTQFLYGGVSFQIAAIAAERATGRTFHELFAARIAEPLGMRETRFGLLMPIAEELGTAKLPWVAGGAVSTLDEYGVFLRMLLAKGRVGDRQVVSEKSVEAMFRDQVREQIVVHAIGFEADEVRYGLGTWIERIEGGKTRVSDPGAFGFTPWIDLDIGVGGVFAVRDRVRRVLPQLQKIQDEVREVAKSPLVAGQESTINLTYDGRERRYLLHVPPHAANVAGLPLVVVLHGGGGNGQQVADSTHFADLADRAGFAVAFPDGTGALPRRLLTWNSGGIPVYAVDHEVDDVGFVRAVVTDIARRVPIDSARIFAAGHSNGGMMAHRLAREAADLFAGIAAVSGAMNFTAASSAEPIAVLIVHGSADEHVRYHGGAPGESVGRSGNRVDASVQDAIDYYVQRNHLRGYPTSAVLVHNDKVRTDTYGADVDGKVSIAPVRVITIEGGGHAWPGAEPRVSVRADRPFDYDATKAVWEFFETVRREQPKAPSVPR